MPGLTLLTLLRTLHLPLRSSYMLYNYYIRYFYLPLKREINCHIRHKYNKSYIRGYIRGYIRWDL